MRISDWSSDVCSSDLVAAVALVGEEIGAEKLVERRGDLRRLLFHHLAGARLEIAPEAFEHRLPLRATARHVVEFLLQPRGEIIADIAFEEARSEEHTSELQSLMRISYAVFCLNKKKSTQQRTATIQ